MVANKQVPQLVPEALNVMQTAFTDVLGTDGHRRLYDPLRPARDFLYAQYR